MINTMNIHSCISLGGYVFSFLLDVIVESKSNSFKFFEDSPFLHSNCITLHSYQQYICKIFSFSLSSPTHLTDYSHHTRCEVVSRGFKLPLPDD